MKAYIKVVYSSDGKSPVKVEGIRNYHGFHKVSGQQAFEAEVTDTDYTANLESLHAALKGTGARYMLTSGKLSEGSSAAVPSCGDRLERDGARPASMWMSYPTCLRTTPQLPPKGGRDDRHPVRTDSGGTGEGVRDIEAIKKAEAVKKHAIELMTSSDGTPSPSWSRTRVWKRRTCSRCCPT